MIILFNPMHDHESCNFWVKSLCQRPWLRFLPDFDLLSNFEELTDFSMVYDLWAHNFEMQIQNLAQVNHWTTMIQYIKPFTELAFIVSFIHLAIRFLLFFVAAAVVVEIQISVDMKLTPLESGNLHALKAYCLTK